MIGDVAGPAISAVTVIVTGLITYRRSSRALRAATRLESRKVDAEAYDRAREIDKDIVKGIREELDRARDELAGLRTELAQERTEKRELRRQVDRLERTVERLRARLAAAGLDVNGEHKESP